MKEKFGGGWIFGAVKENGQRREQERTCYLKSYLASHLESGTPSENVPSEIPEVTDSVEGSD